MDAKVIFPLIRLFLALGIAVLQAITLPIFMIYADYRKFICYQIMFVIGLCDFIQAFLDFLMIFLVLVGIQIGNFAETLLGALYAISWDMIFILILILALNRLAITVKAIFRPKMALSDTQPLFERICFGILYAIAGCYFVFGIAFFCSPFCGAYINRGNYGWSYDRNLTWTATMIQFEYSLTLYSPVVVLVIYFVIAFLIKAGNKLSPLASNKRVSIAPKETTTIVEKRIQGGRRSMQIKVAPTQTGFKRLARRETQILIQSALIVGFASLYVIIIQVVGAIDNIAPVDNFIFSSATDVMSLCAVAINPIIYLAINAQFRDQFCKAKYMQFVFRRGRLN